MWSHAEIAVTIQVEAVNPKLLGGKGYVKSRPK